MQAWLIRAGRRGELADFALQNHVAVVGWDSVPDLRSFGNRFQIKSVLAEIYPNEPTHTLALWAGELWRFSHEIAAGDIIITPTHRGHLIRVGVDQGEYRYRPDFPEGSRHTRQVDWSTAPIHKQDLPRSISLSLHTRLTVARIGDNEATRMIQRILPLHEQISRLELPDFLRQPSTEGPPPQSITAVIATEASGSLPPLTATYLQTTFVPFLEGLNSLNSVIQVCLGFNPTPISVISLSQRSPVNVHLKGVVKETIETTRDLIHPFWRERAKNLATSQERERNADAETAEANAEEARQRAESMRIQNERARLQLGEAKIELAMKLAEKFAPEGTSSEKLKIAVQFNSALEKITETDLTIMPSDDAQPTLDPARPTRKLRFDDKS